MEKANCDLCGSSNHKVKFRIDISEKTMRYYRYARNIPQKAKMTGIHTIVECNNCGLIFTNPSFSINELHLVYSSERIIGANWKNFWYLFNSKLPDTFTTGRGAHFKSVQRGPFDRHFH